MIGREVRGRLPLITPTWPFFVFPVSQLSFCLVWDKSVTELFTPPLHLVHLSHTSSTVLSSPQRHPSIDLTGGRF